jgi:3-deoxy-7-phosphoheptulonate synthase
MVWTPNSWETKPAEQQVRYDDPEALASAVTRLRVGDERLEALDFPGRDERRQRAQAGRRFLLQGGDCAETIVDCRPDIITNKLKILLQMSLVLIHGGKKPVIRVGRFAGQYAKPRSKPVEVKDGVELPSYYGDLVNRPEFTAEARRADPQLLLSGYSHAALTLNFIRSLSAGGFADLHHPEYWDLSFFNRAELPPEVKREYESTTRELSEALRFMEALGESTVDELTRVDFFTSHEGLNLLYESAQTRPVPRRAGHYDLTVHRPWIGERTRALEGAHIEFFRGIRNPVGVKLGPSVAPDDVVRLVERLNPDDEPGKIVLITRMGAVKVEAALPPLIEALRRSGRRVLWVSDPMHGNMQVTQSGWKTRNFDNILREVELSFDAHESCGSHLGGVHFELTGDDVTECIGGGINESDLDRNYLSVCDPRLNYRQALEMAFLVARRMGKSPPMPSRAPAAMR